MEFALAENKIPLSEQAIQSSGWYVGYTHQGRERRAALEIDSLGIEVYLPQRTKWIRHARKKTKEQRPLFPRYLFVKLQPSQDSFMAVHGVDGIHNILSNHDVPLRVDTGLIELIRHEQDLGSYDETTGTLDGISKGDTVRIVDTGQFDDCIATFARADTKRRVEVFLMILGRQTKVSLDVAKIRKV